MDFFLLCFCQCAFCVSDVCGFVGLEVRSVECFGWMVVCEVVLVMYRRGHTFTR